MNVEPRNMAPDPGLRVLRALVDTNVVLDRLLHREPWRSEAHAFWQACDNRHAIPYLSASTLTDIFYIARRVIGIEGALQAIKQCLDLFGVITVDRAVLHAALLLPGNDFEDNVQIVRARSTTRYHHHTQRS